MTRLRKAFKFETNPAYPGSYVADATTEYTTAYGETHRRPCAVRVAKVVDGYRIDQASVLGATWLPWEAITPDTYPTVTAAKAALRQWALINNTYGAN